MTQKDTNEIIAKTMESEKEALFRYACCYLGDIEEAKDILQELFIKLCNTSDIALAFSVSSLINDYGASPDSEASVDATRQIALPVSLISVE